MNLTVFNVAIALGWLLILIGGCLADVAIGLFLGGLFLVILTLIVARMGGIYRPPSKEVTHDVPQ